MGEQRMTRYIDADVLREHIERMGYDQIIKDNFHAMAITIPSADVQPVVHAKWIDNAHGSYFFGCSNCGFIYSYWDYDKYEYCPHCGAKMDGDENG